MLSYKLSYKYDNHKRILVKMNNKKTIEQQSLTCGSFLSSSDRESMALLNTLLTIFFSSSAMD